MPDERVRPTSNLNSGWGAGGDFSYVDDSVVQPSAGSGDTATYSGDSSAAQQWGCAGPSNSGTISAATLWVRVRFDSNSDGYISGARIRLNGTWYSVTLSGLPSSGAWGWASGTATGSYGCCQDQLQESSSLMRVRPSTGRLRSMSRIWISPIAAVPQNDGP